MDTLYDKKTIVSSFNSNSDSPYFTSCKNINQCDDFLLSPQNRSRHNSFGQLNSLDLDSYDIVENGLFSMDNSCINKIEMINVSQTVREIKDEDVDIVTKTYQIIHHKKYDLKIVCGIQIVSKVGLYGELCEWKGEVNFDKIQWAYFNTVADIEVVMELDKSNHLKTTSENTIISIDGTMFVDIEDFLGKLFPIDLVVNETFNESSILFMARFYS